MQVTFQATAVPLFGHRKEHVSLSWTLIATAHLFNIFKDLHAWEKLPLSLWLMRLGLAKVRPPRCFHGSTSNVNACRYFE